MEIFAKNLRKARENAKLTQEQMAERLSIPFHTYRNYEFTNANHREPDQKMLVLIARVLGISINKLFE